MNLHIYHCVCVCVCVRVLMETIDWEPSNEIVRHDVPLCCAVPCRNVFFVRVCVCEECIFMPIAK